ncbi:MAG TPA: cupredoxin family copper-binding protein [Vicinamibacterales bacterium]|jgi:plastocyanin
MRTSLFIAASLAVFAAGCSNDSPTPIPTSPSPVAVPPAAPAGSSASITIPMGASSLGNRAYNPGEIAVAVGDTLTWVNTDAVPHTSTANGGWDSGTLAPGQQFSTTLRAPGTFAYHCTIHPGMVGTVVVR